MSDWEIIPLLDTEGSFTTYDDAFPALTGERLAEARAQWPDYFRGDAWWLPFHAFLLRGPALVLVDAGVGPAPTEFLPGSDTRLPRELERAGVRPEDVEFVFFTHLHIDHVGWAPLFTSARAFVHVDDWDFYDRPETREKLSGFSEAGRLELLDGEREIAPGISALPTPGHSPGHMSLRVGDTFVLGDVAVHPAQVVDPTLVCYGSDVEPERAVATRRETLGALAEEGTRVASPHLPGVFARISRAGDGFAWQPVS